MNNKKLILSISGILLWLIIALGLWQFVKNAPIKENTGDKTVFEIIPRSNDGVVD